MKSLKLIRTHIIVAIGIVYIIITPLIIKYQLPCLNNTSNQSFYYHQCDPINILDKFLILELIGIGLTAIFLFLTNTSKSWTPVILGTVIIAVISIAMYYWHLPRLLDQVKKAPIIISQDSL